MIQSGSEMVSFSSELQKLVAFNGKHWDKNSGERKSRNLLINLFHIKKQDKSLGDNTKTQTDPKPQTTKSDSSNPQNVVTEQSHKGLVEAMMKRMIALFDKPMNRRARPELSTVTCYRCQEKGHYASSCTADKPVMRYAGKKPEN